MTEPTVWKRAADAAPGFASRRYPGTRGGAFPGAPWRTGKTSLVSKPGTPTITVQAGAGAGAGPSLERIAARSA